MERATPVRPTAVPPSDARQRAAAVAAGRRLRLSRPATTSLRAAISSSCRSAGARSSAWSGARAAARSRRAKLKTVVAQARRAAAARRSLRRFVDWVAAYTLAPPGAVLRMAMSVPDGARAAARDRGLAACRRCSARARRRCRPTAGARRVLDAARDDGPARRRRSWRARPASAPAWSRRMAARGLLEAVESAAAAAPFAGPTDADDRARRCRRRRRAAAEALVAQVVADGFGVTLLDGVTGSGKTEVYFEAIAAALRAGPPGAGAAARDRADARNGSSASSSASARRPAHGIPISPAPERRAAWRAVADGRGARRGRRALGAVPAVPRSRPHRRRRGARAGLQAGGRRHLSGARHGGGARAPRATSRSCWSRRRRRSRPCVNVAGGPLPARCICRTATAARSCPRSRPIDLRRDRPARGSAGCRRRCVEALERDAGGRASRRCCSSIAAAMRR